MWRTVERFQANNERMIPIVVCTACLCACVRVCLCACVLVCVLLGSDDEACDSSCRVNCCTVPRGGCLSVCLSVSVSVYMSVCARVQAVQCSRIGEWEAMANIGHGRR